MQKPMKKRLPVVLTAIGLIAAITVNASAEAPVSTPSTTTDSTVRVAAPNALGVIAEMEGANLVSSSSADLYTKSASGYADNVPTLYSRPMPFFIPVFGSTSNSSDPFLHANANSDPWLANFNLSGNSNNTSTTATTLGWSNYAGNNLAPTYNSSDAYTDANYFPSINNKPQVFLQFSSGDSLVPQSTVDTAWSNKFGTTSGEPSYYVATSMSSISQIESDVTNVANKIASVSGGTTRYASNATTIASNFNTYFSGNEAEAQSLTNGLTKKKVLHIVGGSDNAWLALRGDVSDIYGTTYINDAGGTNVVNSTSVANVGGTVSGNNAILTDAEIETLAPDVITTIHYQGTGTPDLYSALKSSALTSTLKSNTYLVPTGVYLWSVRSPEGSLCALWLTKVLHGSERVTYNGVKNTINNIVNIHTLASNFYNTYYHYNTTSSAATSLSTVINNIVNPTDASGNSENTGVNAE